MNVRIFSTRLGMTAAVLTLCVFASAAETLRTQANVPTEIVFTAQRPHADPFNEVTLDVAFTDAAGRTLKVPAFWAGGDKWKVRYASPLVGTHHWQSVSSDARDAGLHGVTSTVEVAPYAGDNPLFQHGPVRVAADRRHFEYADGTPFFWLGDTWWMGLCHRLHWPDEFQRLAADRKAKGFNVVQIVAGLYPDMHPFDPRGANETGFPWEKQYARIRPEYFDAADARLRYLTEQGMTPCIVGAWGYYMPWMGVEKMKMHWRYLIARYGAWPVIWCAAGEANLPWYLAKNFPSDDRSQVHGWTELLRFIRATDPYRRPLSLHPTAINGFSSRHATDDETLLDFELMQTPHGQRESVPTMVGAVRKTYGAAPVMPVIDGEASYEMLGDSLPTQWTRAMFWLSLMNGAKGHTYGANGIWQLNRPGQPHGPSPTAGSPPTGYGIITWEDAMKLPGSTQVAYGKRFFESRPWTQLTPMPESVAWADAAPAGDPLAGPQACGIDDALRAIYVLDPRAIVVSRLKPGASYRVTHFDPVSGERTEATAIVADAKGAWRCEPPKHGHDWVLLLKRNAPTEDPAVRIEADRLRIGMGRSVIIRAAATWPDGRPAAGYLLLPYVNGKRWGAQEIADARGQATMILPLPNPGLAEIQVAVTESQGMLPVLRQPSQSQPAADERSAWALPATGGWPAAAVTRMLTGTRAGADAKLSNVVTVRVDFRKLAPPPLDPEHLIGVQYCELFSPRCFAWNTAQAVPLVGFYRSWDRDVLRQHLIWLVESGADFLLVDWSNQLQGRKHWDERADNDNEVVHSTTMLLEAMATLRDEGLAVPRMVIFCGLINGPATTVEAINEESQWIYHNYVRNPRFQGLFQEYLGKPLLFVFNGAGPDWLKNTKQVPVDERYFTIRWMSSQHQDVHFNEAGHWTWMDGALRQPVTMFQGKPEAMTASVAFFGTDGWKGQSAFGRRGGWTYVESFRGALEHRPHFLQLHQFQEFTGQEESPKTAFYGDSYSVELSDDIEPVSLTCPGYRGNGGWGFLYLNLTRALVDLYRQNTPETTVLAVEQPDRRQLVREDRLPLKWTWLGKQPRGFAVALNGKTIASGIQGTETVVDLHGQANGPIVLRLTAEGAKARYDLSYTSDSLPKENMEPAYVEVEFSLQRHK